MSTRIGPRAPGGWHLIGGMPGRTAPWRAGIAADGEEAIGWLILLAIIAAIILAILYIGLFVLAGVAVVGAVVGVFAACGNFFAVLGEAHRTVKR